MDARKARSLLSVLLRGFAIVLVVSGCGRSDRQDMEALRKENSLLQATIQAHERRQALLKSIFERSASGIWTITWEGTDTTEPRLVLAKELADAEATPQNLTRELDLVIAPGIEYIGVRDATAYLRIRDAELLTQRSGSEGARSCLAQVTFSMTSLEGIDRVHLEFPEGDHASPGFYSRASFVEYLGVLR